VPHIAVVRGFLPIVQLLLKQVGKGSSNNNKQTITTTTTSLNHKQQQQQTMLDKLLSIRDDNGATLLHVAAQYGRQELIDVLLACGSDVDARDNTGRTPMIYAVKDVPVRCCVVIVFRWLIVFGFLGVLVLMLVCVGLDRFAYVWTTISSDVSGILGMIIDVLNVVVVVVKATVCCVSISIEERRRRKRQRQRRSLGAMVSGETTF
jgi:hypothetical protein